MKHDEFKTLDDGLGAAHGLWAAIKLVFGIGLVGLWMRGTIGMARSGATEEAVVGWFLGTVFLLVAVTSFRMLELRYPKNRTTAFGVTIMCLTLSINFLA